MEERFDVATKKTNKPVQPAKARKHAKKTSKAEPKIGLPTVFRAVAKEMCIFCFRKGASSTMHDVAFVDLKARGCKDTVACQKLIEKRFANQAKLVSVVPVYAA